MTMRQIQMEIPVLLGEAISLSEGELEYLAQIVAQQVLLMVAEIKVEAPSAGLALALKYGIACCAASDCDATPGWERIMIPDGTSVQGRYENLVEANRLIVGKAAATRDATTQDDVPRMRTSEDTLPW